MTNPRSIVACLAGIFLLALPVMADRTPLRTGWNLFSAQQDVEMGRVLAEEAESSMSIVDDGYSNGYIGALGNQLAIHAPGYKYPYQFKIVNDSAIDSWALPGGYIYVTSGLVEAAQTEPQLASAIAHQIGHVVMRHASQKVSQDYLAEVPSATQGRVPVRTAMARLDIGFYPDSAVLNHSAEFERQADVIATQILLDARFDANQMPFFFQKLQAEPRDLTAEFFSHHPGVANSAARVRREVQNMGGLQRNLRGDSPDLHTTQQHLSGQVTMTSTIDRIDRDVELPSTRMLTYRGRDLEFRYPDNWRASEEGDAISIAPDNGFVSGSLAYGATISTFEPQGNFFGQTGLVAPGARPAVTSLKTATDQLVADLRRSNSAMRLVRTDDRRTVDGYSAMVTELTNDSPIGGRETDWLVTVLRPDGVLHYFVGVAPQNEFNRYASTFDKMVASIRFID